MSDVSQIPDEMASRTARLINAAEDMRQQAADDLKQIYADLREELKGLGWEGKHISAEIAALKGAISEMRLDDTEKDKRNDKEDRVGAYVSVLSNGDRRARARARENIEKSESEAGPRPSVSAESAGEAGASVSPTNQPETASMSLGTAPALEQGLYGSRNELIDQSSGQFDDREVRFLGGNANSPETAEIPAQDSGGTGLGEIPSGKSNAARPASVDAQPNGRGSAGQTGERVVTVVGPQSGTVTIPEAVPSFLTRKAYVLRPYCQKQGKEDCGGHGSTHCHACELAHSSLKGEAA